MAKIIEKINNAGAYILYYLYYFLIEIPIIIVVLLLLIIVLSVYLVVDFIHSLTTKILYTLLCDNNINKYPWCKKLKSGKFDSDAYNNDDDISVCIKECIMKNMTKKQKSGENDIEQVT